MKEKSNIKPLFGMILLFVLFRPFVHSTEHVLDKHTVGVGSFTISCVTAPIRLPFWIMGEPLTSVFKQGQQYFTNY